MNTNTEALRNAWAGFVNLSADMEDGPLKQQMQKHAAEIQAALTTSEATEPVSDEREAFDRWRASFVTKHGHMPTEADSWQARAALSAQQAAPRTNQCGETCERAQVCATCAGEIDGQAAPKVTCSTCNDNGAVGHPPDNYFPCPECAPSPEAKAQAVPEGWSISRDGDEIRVISPVSTGPGGKSVTRQDSELSARILYALCDAMLAAAPQPPAPSEQELVYCKYCQGSGESTHVVGRGPDAHDEPCNCDKCGGTGVFQAGRIVDVGLLKYCGSGVAHIHARMTAYWSVLDAAWEALKNAGIRPDGNTSVAMAIERLSAPNEQRERAMTLSEFEAKHLAVKDESILGWHKGFCLGRQFPAPSEQRKPLDLENLVGDLSEWSRHVVEDRAYESLEAHIRRVLGEHGIRSTGGDHE